MRREPDAESDGVLAEFEGICQRDARINERLRRIVSLAALAPGDRFVDQRGSVADREALYRGRGFSRFIEAETVWRLVRPKM
jgi:hypothetical protein